MDPVTDIKPQPPPSISDESIALLHFNSSNRDRKVATSAGESR